MKTVHKYTLKQDGFTIIPLPDSDVRILYTDAQRGEVCLWIELPTICNGEKPTLKYRKFDIFGTGWNIPENAEYIGTAMVYDLVWHVYELKGEDNAG